MPDDLRRFADAFQAELHNKYDFRPRLNAPKEKNVPDAAFNKSK